jgi:glyoxylase-like metal-dependent hydrolase (beta-lactamase superfamily II)
MRPDVTPFYDKDTNSLTYVIAEPGGSHAAIIDPVLDYDWKSGRTATRNADKVIAFVRERGLTVDWLLETHVHADHITAAPYLKAQLGGRMGIGQGVRAVQQTWTAIYNLDGVPGAEVFDHLFADGESFRIGGMDARVLATPGHTPACVSYQVGDALFVGDTLFMPDYGTARCDFPGGDAGQLYRSIQRQFALPAETRIFVCHDYQPGGRALAFETSVAEQRASNKHVKDGIAEAEFVKMRTERDATLSTPALLLPAIQLNIRGGRLPAPEANGTAYLKIPLNKI